MTSPSNREDLARKIGERLHAEASALRSDWQRATPVRHCVIDDLVSESDAEALAEAFPAPSSLRARSSYRERKRVGVDVSAYAPVVADFLFAFQAPDVCAAVSQITGLGTLHPDPSLYASGISTMVGGDFLNPHLDNSHDGDNRRYRALNLLYYASPGWAAADGGELEVWNDDVTRPTAIEARFNRLVLMETTPQSWHSVNEIAASERARQCVSNYYFTDDPPGGRPYTHVTSFAGRPEQPFRRLLLKIDSLALNGIGRAFPALTRRTAHRIADPDDEK